jgi:2-polyprenyl-3-methyl-5-hydroxy-6-metoxy-1,4-benzoquinol methylase
MEQVMDEYIEKLERIADVHLSKHPAHIVDSKALAFDREKMLPYVKGPKVLELGCGDGDWTPRMIEIFGQAYVVDASKKLLAHVAAMNKGKVTAFASLFETFMPPEGLKFDTVIATHVLEHVDDPVRVLQRCRGWLAPDGIVLIIVPNATSLHRRLAVMMGIQQSVYDFSPRDHEVGHQRVYDLPALRKDVVEAGFHIIVERGLFLKILPNSMMTEFPDALLKALVDISDDMPAALMANIALVVQPRA